MKVYVSRGSVAAGDDVNAPNERLFFVPEGRSIEEIINSILESDYLPVISGGKATWSVVSNVPLAIVAQEWPEPFMFTFALEELEINQGLLRLHFNYHEQIEPEMVRRVLWGFHARAI